MTDAIKSVKPKAAKPVPAPPVWSAEYKSLLLRGEIKIKGE